MTDVHLTLLLNTIFIGLRSSYLKKKTMNNKWNKNIAYKCYNSRIITGNVPWQEYELGSSTTIKLIFT